MKVGQSAAFYYGGNIIMSVLIGAADSSIQLFLFLDSLKVTKFFFIFLSVGCSLRLFLQHSVVFLF